MGVKKKQKYTEKGEKPWGEKRGKFLSKKENYR